MLLFKKAQVHRYSNRVALCLNGYSTVYLTQDDAKDLAKALNKCAKDVMTQTFENSEFKTHLLGE